MAYVVVIKFDDDTLDYKVFETRLTRLSDLIWLATTSTDASWQQNGTARKRISSTARCSRARPRTRAKPFDK